LNGTNILVQLLQCFNTSQLIQGAASVWESYSFQHWSNISFLVICCWV